MYKRRLKLDLSQGSCFLFGPRQTGKSTLLKTLFPDAFRFDLLLYTEYERLVRRPELVREICAANLTTLRQSGWPVIIDEVQKIPALLDETHWMIENMGLRFVLCGSSARRLRRAHANLLGGRAVRCMLYPLVFPEIPDFNLEKALHAGLLPRHYDSARPDPLLASYVGGYLKEEIAAEALTRNIPAFSRFLEIAALTNGEVVNVSNIARECGVSAPTVREYFQILEDTWLGAFLPAYRKRMRRRLVCAPKFYFFDLAPVTHLTRRGPVRAGSELFGRALEHYILMEIRAHASYSQLDYPIAYWRTASQYEVDFVLGTHEAAIEVKATTMANDGHLRGLRAFCEEYRPRRALLVSLDPVARQTSDGIEIQPWRLFLENLWSGAILRG